ncbi:MAG: ATP synthase F1 subunit delta [Planctomycetota bacterium]|jgi:F-type H+-transporting ATPase subunit delta
MAEDSQARDARLAAELDADVGVHHIAEVYAEALLGAAEKAGRAEAILEELDSLIADVLDAFPKWEEILASGLISHEEKLGILDRTLAGRASLLLVNFLKVVSRHGRLDCLRAIHRRAHELYDRLRGRVSVEVSTAAPLGSDMAERLARSLRDLTGGEPVLEQVVDPSLIGGVVVRVGDTVYDASIATQLDNVRQQMIDRTSHEIQSRRDRFRHPAGN